MLRRLLELIVLRGWREVGNEIEPLVLGHEVGVLKPLCRRKTRILSGPLGIVNPRGGSMNERLANWRLPAREGSEDVAQPDDPGYYCPLLRSASPARILAHRSTGFNRLL